MLGGGGKKAEAWDQPEQVLAYRKRYLTFDILSDHLSRVKRNLVVGVLCQYQSLHTFNKFLFSTFSFKLAHGGQAWLVRTTSAQDSILIV